MEIAKATTLIITVMLVRLLASLAAFADAHAASVALRAMAICSRSFLSRRY